MVYAVSFCQVRISAIFHYLLIIHNQEAKFTKFLSLIVIFNFHFQNSHYCDSKGSWFLKLTGIVKFEYECENEKSRGHINDIFIFLLLAVFAVHASTLQTQDLSHFTTYATCLK